MVRKRDRVEGTTIIKPLDQLGYLKIWWDLWVKFHNTEDHYEKTELMMNCMISFCMYQLYQFDHENYKIFIEDKEGMEDQETKEGEENGRI